LDRERSRFQVRQVCVEIPEDDLTAADRKAVNVRQLRTSQYGTRNAAMSWQEEVARDMIKWEFRRGKSNPCL